MADLSQLVIRPAIDSDIEHLVTLLSADATGFQPNDPSHDVPATFHCPAARIFVAEQGGQIVGTLTASWNGRNGELRYFWVAQHLRRTRWVRSIMDGLYSSAVEYLLSVGMRRILFFVRRGPNAEQQVRMYAHALDAHTVDPIVMAISLKGQ